MTNPHHGPPHEPHNQPYGGAPGGPAPHEQPQPWQHQQPPHQQGPHQQPPHQQGMPPHPQGVPGMPPPQGMPPQGPGGLPETAAWPEAAAPAGPKPKGFLATLLDLKFEESITSRLIRLVYTLALILISISSLVMLVFGFWVFQYGWLLGVATLVATPLLWLFQVVVVRIFLEFVINQFRITEELQAIRLGEPEDDTES